MTNNWLWGDKRMGYSWSKVSSKRYDASIWLNNKKIRTDSFSNPESAIRWAKGRKEQYYGSMKPETARKRYLGK